MPNIIRVAPVLFVKEISAAISFYEDCLGFECTFREGDESNPIYAMLTRDGVELHLSPRRPEWAGHGQLHLLVNDADNLFAEFKANDVRTIDGIKKRDNGIRAFYIRDVDGNFLEFGEII